jgi:hypothetical protein
MDNLPKTSTATKNHHEDDHLVTECCKPSVGYRRFSYGQDIDILSPKIFLLPTLYIYTLMKFLDLKFFLRIGKGPE